MYGKNSERTGTIKGVGYMMPDTHVRSVAHRGFSALHFCHGISYRATNDRAPPISALGITVNLPKSNTLHTVNLSVSLRILIYETPPRQNPYRLTFPASRTLTRVSCWLWSRQVMNWHPTYTQNQLDEVAAKLNTRPRKTLGLRSRRKYLMTPCTDRMNPPDLEADF